MTTPTCRPDNLPEELRPLRQWVVWKLVDSERGSTKRLFDPKSGKAASHSAPVTWGSYDEAVRAYESGGWLGVGFVLTKDDPYTIVDLDACFGDDGKLTPAAYEVLTALHSFTERSQSGKGLHVIVRGPSGAGSGRKSTLVPGVKSFEIYDHTRFFALTGDVFGKGALPVRDAGAECRVLLDKWMGVNQSNNQDRLLSDEDGKARLPVRNADKTVEEVIELLARTKPREHSWYFLGDFPPLPAGVQRDASKDDAGLFRALIPLVGWHEQRLEDICRQSKLVRAKWNDDRKDTLTGERLSLLQYGIRRMLRVMAHGTAEAEDAAPVTASMEDFGSLHDNPPEETGWLVQDLWPNGARGWISGEPKLGKSWLALDMAVAVATGQPCLGFPVPKAGTVFYLTEESSRWGIYKRFLMLLHGRGMPPDVLRGNLKLLVRQGVKLTNRRWIDKILQTVELEKPAVVFIDPLRRYHNLDENQSGDMAVVLDAAAAIQSYGAAVAIVHHSRKAAQVDGQVRAGQLMRGSGDLHAWSDAAIYCSGSPELPNIMEVEVELKDEAPPRGGKFTIERLFEKEEEFIVPGREFPIRLKPVVLQFSDGTMADAERVKDGTTLLMWLKARKGEEFKTGDLDQVLCNAFGISAGRAKARTGPAMKWLRMLKCVNAKAGKGTTVFYSYLSDLPRNYAAREEAPPPNPEQKLDDLPF